MRRRVVLLSIGFGLISSFAAMAQHWEVGGAGGVGIYRNASVTNATGSAVAGFATQAAGGIVIGENLYRHLGGEFRYTYGAGDLKLESGGQEATMGGRSHAIHYDFLVHTTPTGSKFRPFLAAGAGVKVYQGTGKESAFQPLSRFALLTKTDQTEPLMSFGGGVKFLVAKHAVIRVDLRDYITPTPDRLFTPAAGARLKGWLHDFVPLVGVSYVF
jgi:hypothetical protein